jgi:hypothetical protein
LLSRPGAVPDLLAVIATGAAIFYVWYQGYSSTGPALVTGTGTNVAPNRTGTLAPIYYRVGDTVQAGDKITTLHTNNGGSYDALTSINSSMCCNWSLPPSFCCLGSSPPLAP